MQAISFNVPKIITPDMRFVVKDSAGMIWNRMRKRWDPAMDLTQNRPYKKLGHAMRGAKIAAPDEAVTLSLYEEEMTNEG